MTYTPEQTKQISVLNDLMRKSYAINDRLVLSEVISNMDKEHRQAIAKMVADFTEFDEANDPHGEHDFGMIEYNNQNYMFKIDYYDKDMKYLSEAPWDAEKTIRVLTIMHKDEY